MAYFSFARAILAGDAIPVFNHGRMSRDFTYIDDIVDSLVAVLDTPPGSGEDGGAPYRVLNIGSHAPVPLLSFIDALEKAIGRPARLDLQPMQPGDVPATYADVDALQAVTGERRACVPVEEGVRRFVEWYRDYHGLAADRVDGAQAVPAMLA
jgi:UDP-glucuronate 4-epimerase